MLENLKAFDHLIACYRVQLRVDIVRLIFVETGLGIESKRIKSYGGEFLDFLTTKKNESHIPNRMSYICLPHSTSQSISALLLHVGR